MVLRNQLFCALFILICCNGFYSSSSAQSLDNSSEALSNRVVAYKIDAKLDPISRSITGYQRLIWRNPDKISVDELQFHLYLNAFKDSTSTFMVEGGSEHRGFSSTSSDPWGGIDIERMVIVAVDEEGRNSIDGTNRLPIDITERMTFIQPDDNNINDKTVVSVALPVSVPPGESIALDIEFVSKLPEVVARTGWKQKANGSLFVMAAQWFPKLGVYEVPGQRYVPEDAPSGRWNTHQFHANSEFYADFGVYEVDITVPESYIVGASGELVDEQRENGMVTLSYKAEDVHDFAWTASSEFLEFYDQWEHVQLRLLVQPEHKGQVRRHFEAVKHGLNYLNQWVGPYPYDNLTLVDGVGGSNGMEYPTLITCGTTYMLPGWLRILERVTIHELAHQYFYGIIASNEAEEAWLDEGFSSYLEMKIMDEAYGEGSVVDWQWMKTSDGDFLRMGYTMSRPQEGAIYTKSWKYSRNSTYVKATYAKSATVLKTLENYLGWERMQRVLKAYYNNWSFKHPTTVDFINTTEQVTGEELDWFFDQFIYGTHVVDYGVGSIQVEKEGSNVESTFEILRLGDGVFPTQIQVLFEDGAFENLEWDGKESKKEFSFTRNVAVEEVYIDPLDYVWLDINRLNNRKRVTPESSFSISSVGQRNYLVTAFLSIIK